MPVPLLLPPRVGASETRHPREREREREMGEETASSFRLGRVEEGKKKSVWKREWETDWYTANGEPRESRWQTNTRIKCCENHQLGSSARVCNRETRSAVFLRCWDCIDRSRDRRESAVSELRCTPSRPASGSTEPLPKLSAVGRGLGGIAKRGQKSFRGSNKSADHWTKVWPFGDGGAGEAESRHCWTDNLPQLAVC